jgi:succinate dehydrogenase/fumarate reductase cytochrome b subunit
LPTGAAFGCTFAFFLHLCGGIRHLVWDAGYGFAPATVFIHGGSTARRRCETRNGRARKAGHLLDQA